MPGQSKVLLISGDETESSILEMILSEHVVPHSVKELAQLGKLLEDVEYDAVFCGWSFRGGTWNDALKQVQRGNPDLPVIIFCRTGGEREWVEVLEAGAFDLLSAPYTGLAVLSVLEQAVDSYEARRLNKAVPQLAGEAS